MPREIVTLSVGQCGTQISNAFWTRLLAEHSKHAKRSSASSGGGEVVFDEAMSTFFRNVDSRTGVEISSPSPENRRPSHKQSVTNQQFVRHLRARACMIDMEDGVLSSVVRGPIGSLFDTTAFLSDTSSGGAGAGSGNNWGQGYGEYGRLYEERVTEMVRREVERCSSLQSFFLCHSTGGGTGSGLGSRVLEILEDEYSEVNRFTASVVPSCKEEEGGDVVTSPYNTVSKISFHVSAFPFRAISGPITGREITTSLLREGTTAGSVLLSRPCAACREPEHAQNQEGLPQTAHSTRAVTLLTPPGTCLQLESQSTNTPSIRC